MTENDPSMKVLNKDWLAISSLCYLMLPNLIFIFYWFRVYLALPLIALLLCCIYSFFNEKTINTQIRKYANTLILLSTVIVITYFSGIGNFVKQSDDYEKHNLIFHDLITYPWPVIYDNQVLCYYVAYYLPVAWLSKLTHTIHLAEFYSFIWGGLGIFLSFLWIKRLLPKKPIYLIVLFLFFSGLDILKFPYLILEIPKQVIDILSLHSDNRSHDLFLIFDNAVTLIAENRLFFADFDIAHGLLYASQISHLTFAPQHLIGAWLGTFLIYYEIQHYKSPQYLLLISATTFLWSPVVVLGFFPFIIYSLIYFSFKSFFSWGNIFGCILGIFMLLYYQSNLSQKSGASIVFIPNIFRNLSDVLVILIFLFTEVIAYFLLIKWLQKKYISNFDSLLLFDSTFLNTICLSLCLYPFFALGMFNDLLLRISLPSLLVLYLIIFNTTAKYFHSFIVRDKIIVSLIILSGTFEGIFMIYSRYKHNSLEITIQNASQKSKNITKLTTIFNGKNIDLSSQYLGKKDSFFGRHILKHQ